MTTALATVEQREAHPLVVGIQQRMTAPGFAAMLPAGMDLERFRSVTLQALIKNPDILQCSPASVISAIVEAAQDGLEPTGANGGAHLVKFGSEAVLIRDYRGVIRIVIESGAARRVDARPVRHGDEFALDYASPEPVTHKPAIPPTGEVYGYYALFWLRDGTKQAEFMTVDDIEQVRAQSRGKDSLGWTKFFDQMARKTVIKRGSNYLNLRPDIRERLTREDEAEFDGQIISVQRDERLSEARSRIHDRAARLTGGQNELSDEPPPDEQPAQFVEQAVHEATVAPQGDEPDFGEAPADPPKAAERPSDWLAITLGERAQMGGGKTEPGTATDEQRARLKTIFRPVKTDGTRRVMVAAFGLADLTQISEAQANAILDAAEVKGFDADLVALVEELKKVPA